MVWIIRVRGTFIPVRGLQFPDPDVAEADGIAVVLQHDRSIAVCGVGGMFEESRAFDRGVVLDVYKRQVVCGKFGKSLIVDFFAGVLCRNV